jgi:hypothetical protein
MEQIMNRRSFLLATSAVALAGCTGQTGSPDFAAIAADVGTISAALVPFGALIAAIPNVGPLAEVALTAAPVIANLAAQLAGTTSKPEASQIVTQVQTAVNAVITAATGVSGLPANAAQTLKDIQTVMQSISVAMAGAAAASPGVDAARMRLKAFAAGGRH